MGNRYLSTCSTLFIFTFLATIGLWGMVALAGVSIPRIAPIIIYFPEHLPPYAVELRLGRHWLDIVGFPLLTISTYIVVEVVANMFNLLTEKQIYTAIGMGAGLIIGGLWQASDLGMGMLVFAASYLITASIALLVGILVAILLFRKWGDEETRELYRCILLLFFFSLPLSVVYMVAVAANGLYSFLTLLFLTSVTVSVLLVLRGTLKGLQKLFPHHFKWQRF